MGEACQSLAQATRIGNLPPPVTSVIFTEYFLHMGLWMQRLTSLLTPLAGRVYHFGAGSFKFPFSCFGSRQSLT